MKKIAVIIMLLLSASLILSQNISVLEQEGEGHNATTIQYGYNYSSVIQGPAASDNSTFTSSNGTAYVRQIGSNYSSIDQRPRSYMHDMNNSESVVYQDGENTSYIEQNASNVIVHVGQTGNQNISDVYQGGWWENKEGTNEAYITQQGSANSVSYKSYIFLGQPGVFQIEQVGTGNVTTIESRYATFVKIYQTGNRNEIYGTLSNDFRDRYYFGGQTEITQTGNDNFASPYQYNTGFYNFLTLTQTGSGNYAGQMQETYQNITAYNEAQTIQTGDNNYVWQSQVSNLISGSEPSRAYILQVQDNAWASQSQYGYGNYAEIKQWAYNEPKYGDENTQWQDGERNKAIAHTYGGKNTGVQRQTGGNNWTYIKEAGSYNYFYVSQTGFRNAAFEETLGNSSSYHNDLSIIQILNDNQAYISVEGEYNSAKIYQDGSNTAGTSQSDFGILQQGDSNSAEISQYGYNNEAKISQKGNNSTAVIYQWNY